MGSLWRDRLHHRLHRGTGPEIGVSLGGLANRIKDGALQAAVLNGIAPTGDRIEGF